MPINPRPSSFDRTTLSHFDYHWFRGLRYNKIVPLENMASHLDEFAAPEEQAYVQGLREEQQRISQHYAVVRFFLWLFNIGDYARNAYQLAAFDLYNQSQSTCEDNAMDDLTAPYYWAKNSFALLYSYCLATTETAIVGIIPQKAPFLQHHEDGEHVFTIRAAMQPSLIRLGIVKETGARMAWSELKAACRRKILMTHPDRGGSSEQFQIVSEAKSTLTRLVFTPAINNFQEDLFESYNEIAREHAEIAREHAEIARQHAEIARQHAKIARDHAEIARSLYEIQRELAELKRLVRIIQEQRQREASMMPQPPVVNDEVLSANLSIRPSQTALTFFSMPTAAGPDPIVRLFITSEGNPAPSIINVA